MPATESLAEIKATCTRSIELMADGDLHDFQEVIADNAVNREASGEPGAARQHGPEAFLASAVWLRQAFDDLRWTIHEVVADADLVCVHTTMSGRHVRPFILYGPDARPSRAFPPTGRTFTTSQTHWFRTFGGKIIEHWANRDDQGQALQLGWIPPTPRYLLRMAAARRRATHDLAESTVPTIG